MSVAHLLLSLDSSGPTTLKTSASLPPSSYDEMDGQYPGQGQNGHRGFSQNFQFSRQQPPGFQFNSNTDENFNSPSAMGFLSSYSPNIGTLSEPFSSPSFVGTQEAFGTAFGTGNAAGPWQATEAGSAFETASNASTVARLATDLQQHTIQSPPQARHTQSESRYARSESRYSQSEAGSVRHGRVQKTKQRHNSRQTNAVAAISTAGPGTVNDTRSIGAPSERGELSLAANSIDLGDGYFQCKVCHEKKKPKCDMLKHINTHTKPYKCAYDSCTKGFATKNDLERHEKIHMDAKSLHRVFVCRHGKCSQKTKPWSRWDNFKTHLRDVHRIPDPLKEDYHKENPAAQNQFLAGMTGHFGPETATPASVDALAAGEDFSTADTMTLGGQSAALPYLGSGPSQAIIQTIDQMFGGESRGTLSRNQNVGNGQYMRSANTTPTPVGYRSSNPLLNNQPAFSTYYHHGPSNYSTSLMGLPESATANFQYEPELHAPMPRGGSFLTTPFRRGPRSLGQAAPLSPHQTANSIHSHTSFNDTSFSHAGNTSSLTSFAAPSLSATGEGHTTSKTANVAEIPVDEYSPDIAMEDVEADGNLIVDNTEYDLAGLAGGETGYIASPDSHSQGDNSAGIDDMIPTEAVEPDVNISPNKSVIGDDSVTLDTDDVEDTRGHECHNDSFVSPQSILAINTLDTVLPNTADIGTDNHALEVEALGDATPNCVEPPSPVLPVDLAVIKAYLKKCTKEDLEKTFKATSEEVAHRNSGVEVLPSTPLPAHPQIANPTPAVAPEDAGGSKSFYCTSPGCNKFFTSSSGLKKHEVRHKRPFGCTHGCTANNKFQTFGSKNDWKRHEESFHFDADKKPYMSWQCDGGKGGNNACREVFTTKATFEAHLNEKHNGDKTSKKMAQERLNKCCLITLEEAKFWCGFCKKTLEDLTDASTSAGSAAAASSGPATNIAVMPPNTIHYSRLLSSRFNHIDNHFSGRGCEAVTIESWVSLEKHQMDTSAARVVAQAPQPKRLLSQTRDVRKKRPPTESLRDRAKSGTSYHWQCCRCGETCSQMTTQCSSCNTLFCEGCRYEAIAVTE